MAANRNLTFAVAGVALGIFGLSLLMIGLFGGIIITPNGLLGLGVILAFVGFVVALVSAYTSE